MVIATVKTHHRRGGNYQLRTLIWAKGGVNRMILAYQCVNTALDLPTFKTLIPILNVKIIVPNTTAAWDTRMRSPHKEAVSSISLVTLKS